MFNEWLEKRVLRENDLGPERYWGMSWGDEQRKFAGGLQSVVIGFRNLLANSTPERGRVINFTSYMDNLSDLMRSPEAKGYQTYLRQALTHLQDAGMAIGNGKSQANFEHGPAWKQAQNTAYQFYRQASDLINKVLKHYGAGAA